MDDAFFEAGIRTTLILETLSSQRDLGLADRDVTGGDLEW